MTACSRSFKVKDVVLWNNSSKAIGIKHLTDEFISFRQVNIYLYAADYKRQNVNSQKYPKFY